MILIRPATKENAAYIGSHLRADDELEIQTATGQLGSTVVPLSLEISRESFAIYHDPSGLPCALFGVTDDPTSPGVGIVWFVATDDIKHCAISMIRESKCWLDHMSRHYPLALHAVADARNSHHLRWAFLTGFRKIGTVQRNGHRFIHILRNSV